MTSTGLRVGLALAIASTLVVGGCKNGASPSGLNAAVGGTGPGGGGGGGGGSTVTVNPGPALLTGVVLHNAVALNNGKILVVNGVDPAQGGGVNIDTQIVDVAGMLVSSAIQNAAQGGGSLASLQDTLQTVPPVQGSPGQILIQGQPPVGFVIVARVLGASATLLPNGQVLIVGGWGFERTDSTGANYVNRQGGPDPEALASAHLFDPATERFTRVPGLNTARLFHNAMALPNGNVLISGGVDSLTVTQQATTFGNSVTQDEVFDITQSRFVNSGTAPHGIVFGGSAGLSAGGFVWGGLENLGQGLNLPVDQAGTVIEAGIQTNQAGQQPTVVGRIAPTSPVGYAFAFGFTRIQDTLFVAGGEQLGIAGGQLQQVTSGDCFLIDINGAPTPAGSMATPRDDGLTAVIGGQGTRIVVACGLDANSTAIPDCELWDSATRNFVGVFPIPLHDGGVACRLPSGQVALVGGTDASGGPVLQVDILVN